MFYVTPGAIVSKLILEYFDEDIEHNLTPRQYTVFRVATGGAGAMMDWNLINMLLTPEKTTAIRALTMRSIVGSWSRFGLLVTNPYVLGFTAVAAGGFIAAEHGGFDQYVSTDLPTHRNPISIVGALLQDRINTLNR